MNFVQSRCFQGALSFHFFPISTKLIQPIPSYAVGYLVRMLLLTFYQPRTLCCRIRTARSLLGLVAPYPCGFLIWMDFFIFYPCGFYLGCGFSKVPADAFIRMVFHMLPLWFLGCDSTISYPCGFYSACVFSMVPGCVFIRVRFLDLSPCDFFGNIR